MVINRKEFYEFFHSAVSELIGKEFDKNLNEYTFELMSDMDDKRNYSSMDYYVINFYRKHIDELYQTSYDELFKKFTVFAKYDHIYPISIELSLSENNDKVILVKVDPRYRKPSQLKNQETGHPPFKVIR